MSIGDNRWSGRKKAAIRIRAKTLDAVRSWFKKHDYVEVQGPIIIPAIGNWSNYIEVNYPGRKAYLGHGLQPYANILMENIGKICAISPVFRPSKAERGRHLVEYWQIEAEIPQRDLNYVIRTQEQLLSYVCQSLSKEAKAELKVVQRDVKDLRKIHPPFPLLTYDDAIKMLQEEGFDIRWGTTLEWEHETYLSLKFDHPFFISEFPIGVETFFFQHHPQKTETTLSVDLFAPEGYGEISTGGQPVFRKEELKRKMKEEQISPTEQEWYMQLKEEIPYSGFAMGVERLIQWICKLKQIKEASAFPRLLDEIYS